MKIFFVLILGLCLGWMNAQWDVQGQMAIAHHNAKVKVIHPKAPSSNPNFETKALLSSPFIWPF